MRTGRPPIRYRTTELGDEARCSKCREWWPADSEFFYFQNTGKPHSWCIACYIAWRNKKRHSRVTQQPGGNRHHLIQGTTNEQ